MQAYFNGVHIPGLLSLRTLVAKLVSATFVLAAGLIAEGRGALRPHRDHCGRRHHCSRLQART